MKYIMNYGRSATLWLDGWRIYFPGTSYTLNTVRFYLQRKHIMCTPENMQIYERQNSSPLK